MNLVLVDNPGIWLQLAPLTLTKPIAELRLGILTITEKWERTLSLQASFITEPYLTEKYSSKLTADNLFVSSNFFPTPALVAKVKVLQKNEALLNSAGNVIALRSDQNSLENVNQIFFEEITPNIEFLWDLYLQNGDQIKADFEIITANRKSEVSDDPFNKFYNSSQIFIEKGASIKASILNAESGPIYIGKNAQIQEGAIIIGPFAACENAIVAWGSKMRMNTTLGVNCRAGGEVGNSILMANSNKAHDGFLGNSVVGEWCNLGANTNNSNLKNDYSEVKLHSYATQKLEGTKQQFCGTFIGDYTKAGISTMFNTGTVVGVSSNVFGSDFQPKFIPSFSWGGVSSGFSEYRFGKAIEVINATMTRRNQMLSEAEIRILEHIFANTNR